MSPGAGLADVVHDVAGCVLDAGLGVLKVLEPTLSRIDQKGFVDSKGLSRFNSVKNNEILRS